MAGKFTDPTPERVIADDRVGIARPSDAATAAHRSTDLGKFGLRWKVTAPTAMTDAGNDGEWAESADGETIYYYSATLGGWREFALLKEF